MIDSRLTALRWLRRLLRKGLPGCPSAYDNSLCGCVNSDDVSDQPWPFQRFSGSPGGLTTRSATELTSQLIRSSPTD